LGYSEKVEKLGCQCLGLSHAPQLQLAVDDRNSVPPETQWSRPLLALTRIRCFANNPSSELFLASCAVVRIYIRNSILENVSRKDWRVRVLCLTLASEARLAAITLFQMKGLVSGWSHRRDLRWDFQIPSSVVDCTGHMLC
jgi:hypothetical protein